MLCLEHLPQGSDGESPDSPILGTADALQQLGEGGLEVLLPVALLGVAAG